MNSSCLQIREKLNEFYKTSRPYAEHLAGEDETYFKRYLGLIERYGKHCETLLDAGCGTGLSSSLLSRGRKQVVGMDLSELFLKHGRPEEQNGNFSLVAGDILSLPFQENSFDLVGSYLVVEFLPDVERGLLEMVRVLRKGGILVMVAPNQLSPIWPFRDFLGMIFGGPPRPVWCETPQTALKVLWRNLYLSIQKMLEREPRFLYREPDLTCQKVVGRDSDAVYVANPIDLVRFLKPRGFRILRIGSGSNGLERCFPFWSVAVEVVAQKI